jgi:hypothetical protein
MKVEVALKLVYVVKGEAAVITLPTEADGGGGAIFVRVGVLSRGAWMALWDISSLM